MLPVLPFKDSVVVLPEQIEAAADEAVPATGVALTVLKAEIFDVTVPQVPVTTQ
jgi:hypothetical protein